VRLYIAVKRISESFVIIGLYPEIVIYKSCLPNSKLRVIAMRKEQGF